MELICPSCEARYQVPDGSIGEKGRQVSCMNCGNGWHAYPPLVLGTPETAATPSRGLNWQGPEGAARPAPKTPVPAGAATPEPEAPAKPRPTPALAGEDGGADRSNQSRSEQLAEIREMLAEVQSEDRATAALTTKPDAPKPASAVPLTASTAEMAAKAVEEGPLVDPRIAAEAKQQIETAASEEEEGFRERAARLKNRPQKAKPTDVKRLERSHTRRMRRQKNAAAAGSGAFLTGLLLVVMIAAVMIAIYLLHPQIIERVPGSEPALTKYVSTIDGLRVSLAETYTGIQDWVVSNFDDDA